MNRHDILEAAQKANSYREPFDWYAFDEDELVRFVTYCIAIERASRAQQDPNHNQGE